MRRAGKLEAVGVGVVGAGRARFWLPPRADEDAAWKVVGTITVRGREVPKRWIAVAVQ